MENKNGARFFTKVLSLKSANLELEKGEERMHEMITNTENK